MWCSAAKGETSGAAAARRILGALRSAASQPCIGSARVLKNRGAIHDRRAGEIRATHGYLVKAAGGKHALKLGLAHLFGQRIAVAGSSGEPLRQVRYPDGVVRAVCFAPEVLRAAA